MTATTTVITTTAALAASADPLGLKCDTPTKDEIPPRFTAAGSPDHPQATLIRNATNVGFGRRPPRQRNRAGNSRTDDEPPVDRLLLSRARLQCEPVLLLRIRGAAAHLARLQRDALHPAADLGSTTVGNPLRKQTRLHWRGRGLGLRRRRGASRRFLDLGLHRRHGCDRILAPRIRCRRLLVRRRIDRWCRNADRDWAPLLLNRFPAFPREHNVSIRGQADRCARAGRLVLGLGWTRLRELQLSKASILRASGGERGHGHHHNQTC